MHKNTSVSARVSSEITNRLDAMGVSVSDVINKSLFNASLNVPTLIEVISDKEKELNDLKYLLNKMIVEEKIREKELKKFFKESSTIVAKDRSYLDGRIKLFYSKFNIPVNEREFMEMMEKYIKWIT